MKRKVDLVAVLLLLGVVMFGLPGLYATGSSLREIGVGLALWGCFILAFVVVYVIFLIMEMRRS